MSTLRDARRALFEAAFNDGHRHEHTVFKLHTAQKVRTKGGQLEVGGCLFPANRGLPQGEYVVQCAQSVPLTPGEARNAFARVVFSSVAPVKWERMQGQVRITSQAVDSDAITEEWVKTDDLRVDVGSVAFAEPGFGERLEQLAHEHGADDFDELMQLATAGLVELEVVESTPVMQTSQLEGKRSVAMQSGLGDGTYVVYGGYAADGTLTRLLVDFDAVDTSTLR
jgi:hypothetical protein